MKTIGLTGGIGSGKTTVANFFKELGIPVYIADEAGRRLMGSSAEVRSQVIDLLGAAAYEGDLPNRKFIASVVFASEEKLKSLNKIIHPAVEKDYTAWKQNQKSPYVIYEAAILFETEGYKKCDAVILVTAPYEKRIERLKKRDQSSLEEIEARIVHQWSDEKKRELTNFEIYNADLINTKEQVHNLHIILLKPSKS